MATRDEVFEFARQEALRQGVSPDLVLNIVRTESGGRVNAVSNKGARGPMQLMPATARELGVNPDDWRDNIRGGVRYIGQMLNQFQDPVLAVAAYNAGPGAVRRAGGVPNFKETQDYVQKVLGTNMATQDNRSGLRRIDPSVFGEEMTQQQQAPQPTQQRGGLRRIDPSVMAAAPEPVQPQAPQAQRSSIADTLRQFGRQIALTGRYTLEGAGQVLDIPGAPVAGLINAITGTQEALPPSRAISNLLTQAGVPQPEGRLEQTVGNIARTGLSTLTPGLIGTRLAAGAPSAQGMATTGQAVGQGLAAQPTAQLVGGATGQAGIELAQQQLDVQNPAALASIGLLAGAPAAALTARAGNIPSGTRYAPAPAGEIGAGELVEAGRSRGVNLNVADIGEGGMTLQTLRTAGANVRGAQAQRSQEQARLLNRTVDQAKPRSVSRGNESKVVAEDLRQQYNTAKSKVAPLFDTARKLAGEQRIPITQSRQMIAEVVEEFPETADTNIIMRNINRLQNISETGGTYKQIRDIYSRIGAEVSRVQAGLPGGSYSSTQQAALSRLYKALEADVDAWAAPRMVNGRPVYTPAGAAHERAMEQFRQTVVPFRDDIDIFRVVSSRTRGEDYDRAAETFANKLTNNTETANRSMNLMSPKGQQAAQYQVLNDARSAAFRQGRDQVDVGSFNNALKLGLPDNPTPQRVILSRNPELLDEVSTVTDVLNASRGQQTQAQSPIPALGALGGGGLLASGAAGLAGSLGAGPVGMSTAAGVGALATPFLARQAEQAITSLPATRFMLAQPNVGLAAPVGITGGQAPSLYDLIAQPEEPFRAELRGMAR